MTKKKKREVGVSMESPLDPEIEAAIAKAEAALNQEILRKEDPNTDPIVLGPRVIEPDKITRKLVDRASGAAADWFDRVQHPKKHPIKEGIAAEGKYTDKMKTVIAEHRRAKALEKVTDEDYLSGIAEAGANAFSSGIERKRGKVLRRFSVLQPLYELLAKAIDTMPVDTEAQREAKMRAARRGMILVGKARRGEVPPAEIATEIKRLSGT